MNRDQSENAGTSSESNENEEAGIPIKEKTLSLSLTIIRGFVKWCVSRRYLSVDPLLYIKIRKPPIRQQFCPSREEVMRVLTEADGQLKQILSVLAFTGMRSGELKLLQVNDVDLANNWIIVQTLKSKLTRERPRRKVPIHPKLRELFTGEGASLLAGRKGFLFTAEPSNKYPLGDHHINTKHLNDKLRAIAERLGMKVGRAEEGFVIHSFRHYFESIAINSRVPQRAVDAWLGHAGDKTMGSVYYKLTDDESQRMINDVNF